MSLSLLHKVATGEQPTAMLLGITKVVLSPDTTTTSIVSLLQMEDSSFALGILVLASTS